MMSPREPSAGKERPTDALSAWAAKVAAGWIIVSRFGLGLLVVFLGYKTIDLVFFPGPPQLRFEPFAVPNEYAGRGLTGQVAATHLADSYRSAVAKLAAVVKTRGTKYDLDAPNASAEAAARAFEALQAVAPSFNPEVAAVVAVLRVLRGDRDERYSGDMIADASGVAIRVRDPLGRLIYPIATGIDAHFDEIAELLMDTLAINASGDSMAAQIERAGVRIAIRRDPVLIAEVLLILFLGDDTVSRHNKKTLLEGYRDSALQWTETSARKSRLHWILGTMYSSGVPPSWDDARRDFQTAIDLDSGNGAAHLGLGFALRGLAQTFSADARQIRLRHLDGSIAAYRKAIELGHRVDLAGAGLALSSMAKACALPSFAREGKQTALRALARAERAVQKPNPDAVAAIRQRSERASRISEANPCPT